MLVMTIVFSTIFRFDIKNFPVYLLSGQVIFTFFSEATNMAMTSILGGGGMMKKVSLPKYIFPVSKVMSSLVNFFLSLIALLFVMLVTGAPFYWTMLLMPIPIFYIFIFSMGIGLILSAAVVFFRDVTYLYGIFLTALTYFTPLFYPISIIPDRFRFLISLNPMFHFVECFRTVAIYGGVPSLWQNIVCLSLSFVSLATGLYVFYNKQDSFILYI
jgi:ABC-type polysaccharide/polyol phosphate export permease